MKDRFQYVTNTLSMRPGLLVIFFIGFFVLMILWLLTDPMPQPLNYHDFSDSRRWLGIQNSANVISNLPFLLIGTYGLFELKRNTYGSSFPLLIYSIFFFSVTLISIGSAMYHLSPNSDLLVLDRLPMSASFTSLFSIIIWERVNIQTARRIFPLILTLGILSVLYWHWTDDLRPYIAIQFIPVILMPFFLMKYKGTGTIYLWFTLLFYVLAKMAEISDLYLYELSENILSGHTLKHLLASAAALMILLKIHVSGQRIAN